jgi:peptidoglycan/LPS O-acetylase OafA/YrhL
MPDINQCRFVDANSFMKTQEIRPLTSLRFIAALLVFMHHYFAPVYIFAFERPMTFLETIAIEGHIGVTIFFVLSGFLITLRYFTGDEPRTWSLREYFVRRIARIWPLYYFFLVVTLLYTNQPLLSSQTIAYWTLSQGFFMKYWDRVIPTAWSLSVEEAFYLLAPLIFGVYLQLRKLAFFRRLNPLLAWGILLIILNLLLEQAGSALQHLALSTGLAAHGGFMADNTILYTTIFFRFFEFGVGMWCAQLYSRTIKDKLWAKPSSSWLAIALLIVGVLGIASMEYLMHINGGVHDLVGRLYNYPVAVFAGLVILGLTKAGTIPYRILSAKLPVYLGRISYALYLSQHSGLYLMMIILFATFGVRFVDPHSFDLGRAVSIYIGLSIISAVLYETVEKYGAKLVMRIYGFRRKVPAMAV